MLMVPTAVEITLFYIILYFFVYTRCIVVHGIVMHQATGGHMHQATGVHKHQGTGGSHAPGY